ncbi:FmdB family zinc ribbon protein [Chloroflexota bacterium]
MPIYEYECGVCQCRFERKQKFDEEPIAVCPKCEGKARRIIHSVPIIFKGSGFYVTDHRSDSGDSKPAKKASKKVETAEQGSKGESTPAESH